MKLENCMKLEKLVYIYIILYTITKNNQKFYKYRTDTKKRKYNTTNIYNKLYIYN